MWVYINLELFTMATPTNIQVIRSSKRTKSAQARIDGDTLVVRIPAFFTQQQEEEMVATFLARLEKRAAKKPTTDEKLYQRARELNKRFLKDQGRIGSIRWAEQKTLWGSCSSISADIRISNRLQDVPDYVLDSVIIHELVHTFVTSGHSEEFWRWARTAPKFERAEGFLEAWGKITKAHS
ncbi:putative metal-dependent hydrolase [Corynebacterium kutscheri]|uniref:Metal-dependent hydrolase n=2 Tax=Corynebacterium kutscheri TaxID=35755 RepID=A0AB38VS88_9CORY|nr:putative metal-dependent hydrolase [Corynebacterium kutscheri]VEH82222.1 putative metal-dependent hydrolase [Corynebacterium kutscheri]